MNYSLPWERKKLKDMLFHGFVGTLADNAIEIGWILCFSLLADKSAVERLTTMFGVNDAFWVILSSTYYTSRTALVSRLPNVIVKNGEDKESQQLKISIYLFYLLLLPLGIFSFFYIDRLLVLLGVNSNDFSLYIPYFKLSIISILIASPWSVIIPAYLRAKGRSKEATILDHLVAWSMLIGIFITTHIFKLGVLWALVVNILTNAIPLYWFLLNKPIKNFWRKGFEFSFEELKEYWKIVKWELVRRLSPRISALVGIGIVMTSNPIIVGIKYWVSNLAMFPEGWVDSQATLLNSHVSRNFGLKINKPYKDNNYIFYISSIGLFLSLILLYLSSIIFLRFLPKDIYKGIINPFIYIFLFIELITKLRYYCLLSISRTYRHDLNGVAQLIYALPTIILTPLLLYLFIYIFKFEFLGVFLVGAIVGFVQWIFSEIYFYIKIFKNETFEVQAS